MTKYIPKEFKDGDWTCRALMGIDELSLIHI